MPNSRSVEISRRASAASGVFVSVGLLCALLLLALPARAAATEITAAYPSFTTENVGAFQLNGTTALNGTALRLTPSVGGMAGSAFWTHRISLANQRSFSTQFSFNMSQPSGGGADGLTFVVQPGTNTALSQGGGLGYMGIPNSLAIEFDTWQNSNYGDPNSNHVGIDLNGSMSSVVTADPGFIMENGTTGYAWVDYNGSTGLLEVRVSTVNVRPTSATLIYTIDLAANFGEDVFVGFTAATGGSAENHDILSWYFNNDFVAEGINPDDESYTMGAASIAVAATPTSVDLNGTSQIEITATDTTGAVVPNIEVALTAPDGGLMSPASVTTGPDGKATATYTAPGTRMLATVRAATTGGLVGATSIAVGDILPVVDVQSGATTLDPRTWGLVAPSVTVSDADDPLLSGARVRILNPADEYLQTGGYSGALTVLQPSNWEITFLGAGTPEEYQSALRQVQYMGYSAETVREVELSVYDGIAWSTPVIKTLDLVIPPIDSRVQATTRASVNADNSQGRDEYEQFKGTRSSDISSDGRYVVFYSGNSFDSADMNGSQDWYRKDLQTGAVGLVSIASDGSQGYGGNTADSAAISANGRYVVFDTSAEGLVPDDTNGTSDVFVRDTMTGTTTRVSTDSNGDQAYGYSRTPDISPDGRYVVFLSDAPLVPEDTNGYQDAYVRDTVAETIQLASVAGDLSAANGDSYSPSISADGRYVAFQSDAANLVEADTNWTGDVFVHDMVTGATTRASIGPEGIEANSASNAPSISDDGRYVAFDSYASNLTEGDSTWGHNVFVFDRQTSTTRLASVTGAGTNGNSESFEACISGDGTTVAFTSYASDLVLGDENGSQDIFVYDAPSSTTSIVSVSSARTASGSSSSEPSVSHDGNRVSYDSYATNLVADDTNSVRDVFVSELNAGAGLPLGAVDDVASMAANDSLTVAANGVLGNDNGNPVSAELLTDVSNGDLTFSADGGYTYTPDEDFSGEDTFTYRAFDGSEYSEPATVTITVSPRALQTIYGRITTGGTPMGHIVVSAFSATTGLWEASVFTDADGNYTMRVLSGYHHLRFTKAADGPSNAALPQYYGHQARIADATTVKLLTTEPLNVPDDITPLTPSPTITEVSLPSGPVGSSLTLLGTYFGGATSVTFNGTPAVDFVVDSDNQIRVWVPVGAATGKVGVTTPSGSCVSASEFTVIPAPTITGFSPASAPVGTSVTLTGTGLTGTTHVGFNGASAAFSVVNDTRITCTVPAGATTGLISVNGPGNWGYSSTEFTVTLKQTINGTITNATAPLNRIVVTAFDANTHASVKGVFTDASGAYSITGIPAGSYHLRFTGTTPAGLTQFNDHKTTITQAAVILVGAGETITVSSDLAPLAPPATQSVTGTITNASEPLNRIVVTAFDANTHASVKGVFTDAAGVYTITGLPVGDYHLRFTGTTPSNLTQFYDHQARIGNAAVVTLSSGAAVNVSSDLSGAIAP